MRKLFALFFVVSIFAFSQSPQVPSQMRFGGMTLKITPGGQKVIQAHIDALHRSARHHEMMANKAKIYFPIIEQIFRENFVPEEIKYLAIQESGLKATAVSSANAVGYWQFKDFTAREMGLRVDRKVDERKNITAASRGAAKYLRKNHGVFKNWIYAIMAYQTGRAGARKHVNESYLGARKMTIDKHTYWYVMKFLAHYIAFRETTAGINNEGWQLAEYRDGANKDLAKIAKELNVDQALLESYNHWLKGRVPTDKDYIVIVPYQGNPPPRLKAYIRRDRERIKLPVSKNYPDELIPGIMENQNSTIVKINGLNAILAKPDDDISSLSARVGISMEQLKKFNEIGENDKLIAGEFYYFQRKKGRGSVEFHVARHNESLWDISQQYGITRIKLAKMNRMSIIDDLKPGRVLVINRKLQKDEKIQYVELKKIPVTKTNKSRKSVSIPSSPPASPSSPVSSAPTTSNQRSKVKIHTVADGEALWIIAKKYGVSTNDLVKWNELANPNDIRIGQNLQVKAPLSERAINKKIITYTVEKGDTLYGISKKFGMSVDDILELNEMSSPDLSVGWNIQVYEK